MNVRVVAYRKNLPTSVADSEFELDLAESPNIVVNYNWIDIKEPEKRKGSFSQTLKIPFSDRNNQFFENWFNVNLETLVFNTDTQFNATVFVDSVPQLNGFIQLKAIYLNARKYEIVVYGNTTNFFTDIKDKRLRSAFENIITVGDNEVVQIDDQLDHYLTPKNVVDSWTTGLTTVNSDTSNDVMYPIIDYAHTLYPTSDAMFTDSEYLTSLTGGGVTLSDVIRTLGLVVTGNLKPAIRLRRLIHNIILKAGFTVKSTFMGIDDTTDPPSVSDTGYFSRLFMTLAPQHAKAQTYYDGFGMQVSMAGAVTQNIYSNFNNNYNYVFHHIRELGFTNESGDNFDPLGLFSVDAVDVQVDGTDYTVQRNTITIPTLELAENTNLPEGFENGISLQADFNITLPATYTDSSEGTTEDTNEIEIQFECAVFSNGAWVGTTPAQTYTANTTGGSTTDYQFTVPSVSLPIAPGDEIRCRLNFYCPTMDCSYLNTAACSNDYYSVTVNSGTIRIINSGGAGYTNGTAGAQVVMAENMPDITQADFVKDLVNRFNLVILHDSANEGNLIIEPYQDYIASGTTQHWTDKLDLSKEQVIKSTNELQKKEFAFADLLGQDHLNEQYHNYWDSVYGTKVKRGGDFSNGEGKNFSIMSPFIAQGLPHQSAFEVIQGQSNLGLAVAQKYKVEDGGSSRLAITDNKPSIFYYSGTPVTFSGNSTISDSPYKFWIYSGNYGINNAWNKYASDGSDASVQKFPLCTQYTLDNVNGITSSTKALLWDWVSPKFEYPSYCFNPFGNVVTPHNYYYDYWSQYINEIYDKSARLMECHLYLKPSDLIEFESNAFSNPVYIKNTLWRVLKIEGYLVGGNQSTKVTLIKVIEKLNYNCVAVPSSYNSNGSITFVDPEDLTTEVTITNDCCEDLNQDWTFNQTNESTGVGTCYHNLNISSTAPGTVLGVNDEGEVYGTYYSDAMPVILPLSTSTENKRIKLARNVTAQTGTVFLEATTIGTTASTLKSKNLTGIKINTNNMAFVEVDIIGTVVRGTNAGAIGVFKKYTLLSNIGTTIVSGTSGGEQLYKIEGTNFPTTPTINLTSVNTTTGYIEMTVTNTNAADSNQIVNWVAQTKILSQRIIGADGEEEFNQFAIYQDGGNILMQNAKFLEWN